MSKNLNTNPADKFCRNIINQYPESQKIADMFYHDRTIVVGQCPDWCALPSSFIASFIEDATSKQKILRVLGQKYAIDLTTALLWSRNKMIYRFDETLEKTLEAQPLDGKIPIEAFDYLPYPCVYIERNFDYGGRMVKGFFSWLDWGTKENIRILHLNFLLDAGNSLQSAIPIKGSTIKDSVTELANSFTNKELWGNFTVNDVVKSPVVKSLTECINLLLYLCSEKPDMPDDTEIKKSRSRDSYGNPKRAIAWGVGTRIGAALRKATVSTSENRKGEEVTPEENKTTKSSPRPHIRRAHWHSFWKGKRGNINRKLILRWLPPIAVNIDDEEMPTVIKPIKG